MKKKGDDIFRQIFFSHHLVYLVFLISISLFFPYLFSRISIGP